MSKGIYKQKCKDCETDYYIEDLKLIAASSCPKCDGKGLHISEHKVESDKRHDDALSNQMHALPDWIPPQTKTKEPLLTIELQDANSIPKVYYDGKEITNRCRVTFDWVTKEADSQGGMKFHVEYVDDNGTSHTITKRVGDFA